MSRAVIGNRIDELVVAHGSLSRVAEVLSIDKAYLSRLRSGEKVNPSEEVLRKLGLYSVVEYRRVPQLQPRTKST